MENPMVVLLILAISIIVLWALYRNDTENFENRGLESFTQNEGGVANPTNTGMSDPTNTGMPEPTNTGMPEPTNTGMPDPTNTGMPDPTNTGMPEPTNTGMPDPTNTGMPDPTNTGMPEPTNTGMPEPTNTGITYAQAQGDYTAPTTGISVPQVDPTIFAGIDTTKPHVMAGIYPTNSHTHMSGGTNAAKGSEIQHYDPQNVGFAFYNTGFEGTLNVFAPSVEKTIN